MTKFNTKCSVHRNFNEGSCFTLEELLIMVNQYNKTFENKIIIKQDKKYILKELINNLKQCNGDHVCIVNTINKKILNNSLNTKNIFRPQGTKGRRDWLTTIEINNVMTQYELKYPNFKFGGAIPRDILRIDYPLMNTKYNIRQLELDDFNIMKKNIIGYIYNLDESHQSGSHWVALYCNLDNCQVYFFDSYGLRPHKDIRIMVDKLCHMCYYKNNTGCVKNCQKLDISDSFMMSDINKKNKIEKKMKHISYNRNRHQYKNTECGVYSLNFIIKLLEGKTFEELTKNKVSDDEINKQRDILFMQTGGKRKKN